MTYKPPRTKTPPKAIFWDIGRFSRQIYGKGRHMRATSVRILGIALPMKKCLVSTVHFPGCVLFQKAETGVHWKIVTRILICSLLARRLCCSKSKRKSYNCDPP